MLKKITASLKSMISGKKSPGEVIEAIKKEMNETIPLMSKNAAVLREQRKTLEGELTKLTGEEKSLLEKKRLAEKNGKTALAESAQGSLEIIRLSIERTEKELARTRDSYPKALETMRNYIRKREEDIRTAILAVEEIEKAKWYKEYRSIMKQFSVYESLDAMEENDKKEGHRSPRRMAAGEELLLDGEDKIRRLRELGALGNEKTSALAQALAEISGTIIKKTRENPALFNRTKPFLTSYLDSTITILEGLIKRSSLEGPKTDGSIEKIVSNLETILRAFNKLHEKILDDDMMALDAEMKALEVSLKMEDLV